jgi:Mlc titration factor MtfA (ptsG expression regulator)
MPFDTTYYITQYNENVHDKVIIKGGKDTLIRLGPWQLPSGIDSGCIGADSIVLVKQQELVRKQEADRYIPDKEMIFIMGAVFLLIFLRIRYRLILEKNARRSGIVKDENGHKLLRPYLTYYGDELDFSEEDMERILSRRFPYFTRCSLSERRRFIHRLQEFIGSKTFKIHDKNGFREMPVLISAAAIQLTFGLKKYLLPNFEFIHVYPREFHRKQSGICLLEGNVSGHAINLSWKHFLEGYHTTGDGQNVGLHEMAHALYYQTFIAEENVDKSFRDIYDDFIIDGNKAFNREKINEGRLYTDYALINFQEFWAESAEIFFEKPRELQKAYPKLYETIKLMLNQDPAASIASVFG